MSTSTPLFRVNMKVLSYFSGMVLILLSTSCSNSKNTSRSEADDRYYSLADANRERRNLKKLTQQQGSTTTQSPAAVNTDGYDNSANDSYQQIPDNSSGNYSSAPSGGETVTNNYHDQDYDMDNYYDFMYASRIRRFNNNSGNGFGYYNPYYTNMYWYNNDPFMFGNSIYSTYGFYNPYVPWGGPGLNIGWNNFGGFNMNNGFNPYAYNNPWRWNSWGYNPHVSPFAFNPYAYNPYGFGFGGYSNGFYNGMAYGLMMNNMYNNPVYYNSFDNNSYNPTVNYGNGDFYGPNTGGSGSGVVVPGAGSPTQVFSNVIGQAVSNSDGGKVSSVPNSITPAVNQNEGVKGNTTAPVTSGKTEIGQAPQVKGQTPAISSTAATGVKPDKASQYSSVQSPKQGNQPSAGTTGQTTLNNKPQEVKTNTSAPVQVSQQGKEGLINSGVIRNTEVKSPQGNYSSAPISGTSVKGTDNSPAAPFSRPSNIDPKTINRNVISTNTQRPQPVKSPEQLNNSRGNTNAGNYSPATNGVRNQVAPGQGQASPSQQQAAPKPAQPNNYQQYQQPRNYQQQQPSQEPRNNYQQPAPRQEQRNNYQQQQAPQQRNNNYQQQAPRQQRYEQPAQPRQAEPRMSSPSRGSESSPRMNNGGRDSSPRMNSGGSGSSPRMNSGGSGSPSGGRVNAPRR